MNFKKNMFVLTNIFEYLRPRWQIFPRRKHRAPWQLHPLSSWSHCCNLSLLTPDFHRKKKTFTKTQTSKHNVFIFFKTLVQTRPQYCANSALKAVLGSRKLIKVKKIWDRWFWRIWWFWQIWWKDLFEHEKICQYHLSLSHLCAVLT